jgi:hypothetical protein
MAPYIPELPDLRRKEWLHRFMERLIKKFGRDRWFSIDNLYNQGTNRETAGDRQGLPPNVALSLLRDLEARGLVVLREAADVAV